jgi:hypothetical protein
MFEIIDCACDLCYFFQDFVCMWFPGHVFVQCDSKEIKSVNIFDMCVIDGNDGRCDLSMRCVKNERLCF